ncbi:hypothetical protein QAD02_010654 [Eretmocerus hayati]|uniref:Uncharacterized protein n=1 Tax=Eretmocerus hayati TaxID=131215 RepID=A0ACC2NVH7_9HYME|nr:hypothetical protein QAD02_010654 [Eretmocerus hayati]
MASKRQQLDEEDSYTGDSHDEEEEMDVQEVDMLQQQSRRRSSSGRPRKSSGDCLSPASGFVDSPGGFGGSSSGSRKRGRGPSKRPCLNRNALMARENRQRKKEYMERIEGKLKDYQQEHHELSSTIQKQATEIKRLNAEVTYLKTVLNNNTVISSLLKSMNDSLKRMHGDNRPPEPLATSPAKPNIPASATDSSVQHSADVLNWLASGQERKPKTTNVSGHTPASSARNDLVQHPPQSLDHRIGFSHSQTPKIARKTMPLNTCTLAKMENPSNPSSVESIIEDDDRKPSHMTSSECSSHCEYYGEKSSAGPDNQPPTTPISTMSHSMDKGEASLSDTDFSQLSSFNVDLFDNFDKFDEVANPLQFDQVTPDIFNEESLFHSLDREGGVLENVNINPLETGQMSDAGNEKTLFNSLENTGVCLHINSSRVSLEYCSICHLKSLKSEGLV